MYFITQRVIPYFFFASTLFLFSCEDDGNNAQEFADLNDQEIQQYIEDNNLNATGTESGLFYEITKSNSDGQVVNDGDSVIVHFVARLVSGAIVDSTSEIRDRPDRYLIDATPLITGLEEGIKLMKEGEEAILLIPSYIGYGSNLSPLTPPNLPPFSTIIYTIKLVEVRTEDEQIRDFETEQNIVLTDITDTRLRYARISEGTPNTLPQEGDEIRVTYRGTLLNGTEFDSNLDSSFTFFLGFGQVIAGWDEGLALMNQGETGQFIIPSELAYGANGIDPDIPPYAPLFFEITYVKSELLVIQQYLEQTGQISDTISTESGLIYVPLTNGTGISPDENSKVTVNYTGSYLNFDQELVQFEQFTGREFDLQNDNVTTGLPNGLKEGLQLMMQGGRTLFLLESGLAYGFDGDEDLGIQPRSPVIYEVELVSVN